MERPRLLITGCTGLIGTILVQHLAAEWDVFGVDICVSAPSEHVLRADIANYAQVTAAVQSIAPLAAIVHLAGDPRVDADWQSTLMNNVVGTRNIYAAAQQAGVPRVVFASSNHVTGGYEGFPPTLHAQPLPAQITPDHPIRPDSYYGVSKAFGEAIARMFYELHGVTSVCLRIGSVLKDDDPTQQARYYSTWLSHRDLVHLVMRSLLADVQFGIYYGISQNQQRFWDISNAEAELGYRPIDDAARRTLPRS